MENPPSWFEVGVALAGVGALLLRPCKNGPRGKWVRRLDSHDEEADAAVGRTLAVLRSMPSAGPIRRWLHSVFSR